MQIFPCPNFCDHLIIIRTKATRGKKFERIKKTIEGEFLKGIINNNELNIFMKNNNIIIPSELSEYFVDYDLEDLDQETSDEFEAF